MQNMTELAMIPELRKVRKRLHYPLEVMLVCARWYAAYPIDSMAAHSDGYSPRCSCTMRTARSRTSGENFVDFLMAPFS